MGSRRTWSGRAASGAGAAVLAAAVAVGVAVTPSAAAAPPPVSPEDLVASVLQADPGPFNGTVEVDNALGLPALPQVPQLGDGTSSARVWSGGDGKGRVALPSADGERTLVSDGRNRWSYDSAERTATRAPAGGGPQGEPGRGPAGVDPQADPAGAARSLIGELRRSSGVAVDGTGEVAGRPVYQLVLTPAPTERTLLREVRVAVDAEKRVPLELTVLATGSPEPALRAGFSDVTFGSQDPSLFTFTPPPGTRVEERDAPADRPDGPQRPEGERPRTVGDGWDTVVVARRPQQGPQQDGREQGGLDLSQLGSPVSGPWGNGRLITTAVASAIVADDGRVAAGAVPEPVLTEALTR